MLKTVAVIGSKQAAIAALSLAKGAAPFDVVEVRLDSLGADVGSLPEDLRKKGFFVLLTARHPDEGGDGGLSAAERGAMIRRHLKQASYVDLELRSLPELEDLASEIKSSGARLILSAHDFTGTPERSILRDTVARSLAAGADIVKIATCLHGVTDLARLAELLESDTPMSVMGMGPLGGVSRALFGQLGSVLNYGWLDKPNAPGQWPVSLLADCYAASLK